MQRKAYQADFLFLGDKQVILNGVLELDESGQVLHFGENASSSEIPITRIKGGISPGFINCHCHLELSHLKGKVKEDTALPGFIQELQSIREAEKSDVERAAARADQMMKTKGIVAVADICNGSNSFEVKRKSDLIYHNFVELFGFDPTQAQNILERGRQLIQESSSLGLSASLAPHSPYSVSKELFQLICQEPGNTPFSIHNQENESENDLFLNKAGSLFEMLHNFGLPVESFHASGKSSLQSHLTRFPQDQPLLLVHNTFTSREDIEFAIQSQPHLFWCFCPNANWFIERKLPQVQAFLAAGQNCVLGTDSLASNHDLSILSEMLCIQANVPNIETIDLIQMACSNGAKFLNLTDSHGRLILGKTPGINWIQGIHPSGRLMDDAKIKVLA